MPPSASARTPVARLSRRTACRVAAVMLLLAAALPVRPQPGSAPPPADVRTALTWIQHAADNADGPFGIIDKKQARLWVYDAQSHLLGSAPVLLGAARGDASVPGIGERPIEAIRPFERTTPAGRFAIEPGRNAAGEDIFWIDYDAAVSMHRVRATVASQRRLQRLATPNAADNRISYGCINVPTDFFNTVIQPLFTRQRGVLYVLPETRPVQSLWATAGVPSR